MHACGGNGCYFRTTSVRFVSVPLLILFAWQAATTDSVLASPARMTSRVDPEEEASDGNSSDS